MTGSRADQQNDAGLESSKVEISNRLVTIPNLLCFIRLVGAFALVPIALQSRNEIFLWVFIFLAMTDWFDGKLAILLNQRTFIGARLDSWADAALYAALLFGLITMYATTLGEELAWVIPALGTYCISTAAGFWKYRRWPSYHTRTAKTSWLLTAVAVIALFMDWSVLPLRIAAMAIIITNIEAILITIISPVWRADVTSFYHILRGNTDA